MPELIFQVTGVEPVNGALTPLLHFKLEIAAADGSAQIQGAMLNAQIQIECPERKYNANEKKRLADLFGVPERWGQTLRNRLWAHVSVNVPPFRGNTSVRLPVPCTFDLNLASAKYFNALEGGEVSLLFLFSGSIFYLAQDGRLQMERIPWDEECIYRMRSEAWRELMDGHYPDIGWLYLRREVFDRFHDYKVERGLAGWEETIEQLLSSEKALTLNSSKELESKENQLDSLPGKFLGRAA
jgi:hypothetical protein